MRKIPKTFTLSHVAIDNLKNRAVEEQRKPSDSLNLLLEGLTKAAPVKSKSKRFVPPLLSEIHEYMTEHGISDLAESNKFNDYYESNGWKVGKNPMKDWKASARNWIKNTKGNSNAKSNRTNNFDLLEQVCRTRAAEE